MRDEVRTRFRTHLAEPDASEIKVLLAKGKADLGDFQRAMNCAPDMTPRGSESSRR